MIASPPKFPAQPVHILMMEDNQNDVFLFKEHLRQLSFPVEFNVARDGVEGLLMLRHSLGFKGKQDPDFILLDLNLPRKDGREVLAEVKEDPGLRHIPVVVLTSSIDRKDVEAAYQNHADEYFQKPDNLDDYPNLMRNIQEFYLKKISGLS